MSEQDRHGLEPDDDLREIDADEPSIDRLVKSLSDMMDGARGEGWDGINGVGSAMQRERDAGNAAFRAEARLIHDVFTSDNGRKVLNLLLDQTLRRPNLPENIAGMTMDQISVILLQREAENNFVRTIMASIAAAINQPLPNRSF
jgi:hypothetical protein